MSANILNQIEKEQEKPYWGLIIVLLSIALFFLYVNIQSQITYQFSPLFDGNEYLKTYKYFNEDMDQFEVSFPFNTRIMVPFLASLIPLNDPINRFHMINLFFLILSTGMIYILWRRLKFTLELKLLGFFLLLFHWPGIIRYNIFDPITVDVPVYFFEALMLWLILKKKYVWIILIGPVSILFKELFLALLLIFWIYYLVTYKKSNNKTAILYLSIALVLTFFTKMILNEYFPPIQEDRGSIITILFHLKESILSPFRIFRWITSLFVAYGIFLFIGIIHRIRKISVKNDELLLISVSILYFSLSFLGGGDFTRLLFLGFPFIMTWILLQFKDISSIYLKVAMILSFPLMKLHKNIPDPANTGWQKFNNWFPEFAPPLIDILWLLYGMGAFLLVWQLSRKISIKI